MPERYDRSVCATELLLRNTIVQKMIAGWKPVEAYCLPLTVANNERTGRSGSPMASTLCENNTPETSPTDVIDQTQQSQTSGGGTQIVEVTLGAQEGSLTEQTPIP